MNRRSMLSVFALAVIATGLAGAQQPGISDDELTRRLASPVDSVRMTAFFDVVSRASVGLPRGAGLRLRAQATRRYLQDRPAMRLKLIALLEIENGHVGRARGNEEFSDYYADLIGTVAALQEPEAFRGLLGALRTGDMATRGLAALGEVALGTLLDSARSLSGSVRQAAAITLGEMVDTSGPRLSATSRSRVRITLIACLADDDHFVRLAAIEALEPFSDQDVLSAVADVAKRDPYRHPKNGDAVVRDAAAAFLTRHGTPRAP